MSGEMVTPQNVSIESLKQVFDAAYLTTEIDEDGDLVVRDGYSCFMKLEADNNRIWVAAFFGIEDSATEEQKLRFANAINSSLAVIRACITKRGRLMFDHYIRLDGGLPPKTLVMSVRNFLEVLHNIGRYDEDNIVA